MEVVSIILAAGKGKRMNSDLPKPMHKIAGKSLMNWLEDSLDELKISKKLKGHYFLRIQMPIKKYIN